MKKTVSFDKALILLLITAALILTSCGGGGGGGSGNVSVFGSSGWGYTDLFNNHTWEYTNGAYKTTIACNNSKLTIKNFLNGVEQSGTVTAPYELKDAKDMGKSGKIKCSCINNGAETEFTFNKLISPETVTFTLNGASITFTKQ